MLVKNKVAEFLKSFCLEEQRLLLGLSGGPDSMALFHILLTLNCKFEVAHIDHGWRSESILEAEYLRKQCET